jgi:hypothetical protein
MDSPEERARRRKEFAEKRRRQIMDLGWDTDEDSVQGKKEEFDRKQNKN